MSKRHGSPPFSGIVQLWIQLSKSLVVTWVRSVWIPGNSRDIYLHWFGWQVVLEWIILTTSITHFINEGSLSGSRKSTAPDDIAMHYSTHAGPPCMSERTVQGTQCGQKLTGQSQCDIWSVGLLKPLFLSVVIIVGDPRALLESLFLDISTVSGPIFLKPTLFPIVKQYTLSSVIISSL